MKMFCCWWSFKPTVSPVVTMAIHTFVQWAFGFSYVLFVATAARDQIHNILCCAVCVRSQSYSGPRRWLHSASRGYHFAALTLFLPQGRHSPVWLSSSEFGLSRARTRKSRRLLGRLKLALSETLKTSFLATRTILVIRVPRHRFSSIPSILNYSKFLRRCNSWLIRVH